MDGWMDGWMDGCGWREGGPGNERRRPAAGLPGFRQPDKTPFFRRTSVFGLRLLRKNDTVFSSQREGKNDMLFGAECHGSAVNGWPVIGPAPVFPRPRNRSTLRD